MPTPGDTKNAINCDIKISIAPLRRLRFPFYLAVYSYPEKDKLQFLTPPFFNPIS